MNFRNYIIKNFPRLSRIMYPKQIMMQELLANMAQSVSFDRSLQVIPMLCDPNEQMWEETFNNMVQNARYMIEEAQKNSSIPGGNYCVVVFLIKDKFSENFLQAIKGCYLYHQLLDGKWEKFQEYSQRRQPQLLDTIPNELTITYPNSFGQFETIYTGKLFEKIFFTI